MELRHQLDIPATFKTIKLYVMKGTCHIYWLIQWFSTGYEGKFSFHVLCKSYI